MESTAMLDGKIALVTGSTRGIGWAIARMFAAQGATLIVHGAHSADVLAARLAELQTVRAGRHIGRLADVADPQAVKQLYATIFQEYKRLDVLVNNAGIMRDNLLGMVGGEETAQTFAVNIQGVLYNMQYAARLMARGGGGSIINMTSIIGRFGNAGQVVYSASKAAVIGLTYSAAKELAPQKIRVNAVAPGFIDTDMTRQLPQEKYDQLAASVKMGRVGRPEDVAGAALFLASEYSAYITGQILGVDGGMGV
jgi:3-oxoacyl-[acyl-carrier protein] reductase